jgi:DeoR family transcriptional regulator, fructose operon transcriptional repressor
MGSGRLAPDSLQPAALPAKRQRELLRLIHEHGQMRVNELSSRLNVSGYTIRRDLDSMARRGLITRTYGGAVVADGLASRTADFVQRMSTPNPAKRRIARAACKLIEQGETLIVGGGSTTRHFGEELPPRGLTIVTNNVSLLTVLAREQKAYLLGGQYHHDAQILLGPVSLLGVCITPDTAVIGAGGITAEAGLTTSVLEEARMISSMIAAAHQTIVLADSTKFGRRLFGCIGPLSRVQILVTDEAPQGELAVALQEARVRVVVAKEE